MRWRWLLALLPITSFATQNPCQNVGLKTIEKNAPVKGLPIHIVSKKPIKNLCEVIVELNGQLIPLYISEKGDYIISGEMFSSKRNITQSDLQEVKKEILKKRLKILDKYVVATYKPKKWNGKWFYFIADPECPYCSYVKERVKKLADKTHWGIKLVFFPLPFHKNSLTLSKSFICNKKNFQDYLENDFGNMSSSCKEAAKENFVLKELNFIKATPTFLIPEMKTYNFKAVVGTNLKALEHYLSRN